MARPQYENSTMPVTVSAEDDKRIRVSLRSLQPILNRTALARCFRVHVDIHFPRRAVGRTYDVAGAVAGNKL